MKKLRVFCYYFIEVGEWLDDYERPIFRDSVHRSIYWVLWVLSGYARDNTYAFLRIVCQATLKHVVAVCKWFL